MVSVIMPVYNAESYLSAAIASVHSQTFRDWELILVDDGSTDSSGRICDLAAGQSAKIKVVHKQNGGLSSARNAGLDIATGSHIFFLDADDTMPPHALESLTEYISFSGCDIVCGDMEKFMDSDSEIHSPRHYTPSHVSHPETCRVLQPEEAISEILYQKGIDNSAGGKLYAASIWDGLRFREGIGYEDLDIICPVVLRSRNVGSIPVTVYHYRQHPDSYIHTFNLKRRDVLDVTARITTFMENSIPSLAPAARSRELSANFNILSLIAANASDSPQATQTADRCWKRIKELRGESLRNPSVRIKNKVGIILSYLGGKRLLSILAKLAYRC